MADGWIKLHRSIQESWLWKKYPFSEGQAWIDLLLLANHEDTKTVYKGEIITCERGTVNRSILSLSERWQWSRDKTRRFLKILESDEMVITNITTNRTTITIVNYGVYQDLVTTNNTTSKSTSRQRVSQRVDINKNDKNDKNERNNNNKYYYSDDPELNEALIAFVKHRKNLKKPLTDDGIELIKKKLDKMTFSVNEQIEIINQSIENGWQGIFPLKEEKKEQINKKAQELNDFYERAAQWAEGKNEQ